MTPQEKEVSKAFSNYWKTHFSRGKGTFEKVLSLWHPDITAIGTGKDEIVKSYSDFKIFLKREFEEVNTTIPVKILWTKVQMQKDQAVVLGETEVTVSNENNIKISIRVSTVFKKQNNKWLLYHIHGSLPSSAQRENESFPIDGLIAEKEKLEKEVAEKTADLLNKNKELKIESSLEKVRATAMAMRRSEDMLKVCKTISLQLQKLGFKEIRNVQTAIFYPQRGTYMNYEYYAKHKKTFITDTVYTDHKIAKAFAEKMIKGKDQFYVTHIKGKKVKEWIVYQKTTNVFIDKFLNTASSLNYYWYSLGPVALGISTYLPLTEDEINLFKRYLKVFELAYRRYLDIEKAFAQAREAEIELALERVRARTIAMHKSEEIGTVASVLFHQLQQLDLPNLRRCLIGIVNEKKGRLQSWHTSLQGDSTHKVIDYPIDGHPVIREKIKGWRKGKPFSIELSPEELKDFIKYIVKHGFEYQKGEKPATKLYQNHATFKYGYLEVATHEPIAEQEFELIQRFARVFEQTYTRFLDLQKAEAQAREAQIESALEKVRSRSLAMHKSEELKEVIQLVYEQFVHLNIYIEHTGFIIDYKSRDDMNIWLADQRAVISQLTIPYFDSPHWNSFIEAKEKGQDFFANLLNFEEKNKFYKDLFKFLPDVPKEAKEFYFSCPGLAVSTVLLDNIGLYIENFSGTPYSDEENSTLMRLGKVFQQTYTRFLDLQKAEAQSREAQIEASMEKVRSSAMAMHSSNDISSTTNVVFSELKKLGIKSIRCGIALLSKSSRTAHIYAAAAAVSGEVETLRRSVEMTDHPSQTEQYESWLKQENYFTEMKGEELRSYYQLPLFYSSASYVQPQDYEQSEFGYYIPFSEGLFYAWTKNRYSEDEINILLRFKTIIDLTFRRYFDLQKAEAQAREAQIEAALEKVRSRSLAMHKSEELQQVVTVAFEKLKDLNISMDAANINIFTEGSRDADLWIAAPGQKYAAYFHLPYIDYLIPASVFDARENGHDFFTKTFSFEEKNKYFHYLFEHSDFKQLPDNRKNIMLEASAYTVSFAFTKNSAISMHNYSDKSFTDEENDILKRFAKVFDQAYIRFLDLQKAEAQARESQIEAALERVRSVAMSMMKSDELLKVCESVFTQLKLLGFNELRNTQIYINYDEKQKFENYNYSDYNGTEIVEVLYDSHPKVYGFYTDIQKADDAFADYKISGSELKDWKSYLTSLGQKPDVKLENAKELHYYFYSVAKGALGISSFTSINDDEVKILKRFRNVFNLSYQRYSDIALAEAQAREAKIEAALERVRSRTMAMQQSDELAETAAVVFKQLINLGIEPNRIYIVIIKDENGLGEFWITDEDGSKVSSGFTASLNDNRAFQKMFKGWKEKKKSITLDMQGEELQEYFRHLTKLNVPFKGGLSQKRRLQYIAYFSKGFIGVASPDETRPETIDLLERFAAVFNLTYTRFNDLQQAEAQNKIIQAENERKTKELEEAREIQLAMLPKEIPVVPNLDIKVYMQTATEVGGDYYDFSFRDDGSTNIAIGDATGHGMKAGTIVTMLKSLFIANSSDKSIEGFFATSNAAIKNSNLKRMMAGFAMLNVKDHKAKYINAAMPPVYHYKKNEAKVEEIKQHNLPLGAMKIENYNATEINLNIGDVLIMMSDGFPELHNPTDELFGYDRVYSAFEEAVEREPIEIIRYLNEVSARWTKGKELQDDVTFVVIKIK